LDGAVLRNYTGLGWDFALLETSLDAGFCRHDEYAHQFPTVIAANAAIQNTTTKRNF
jgi:hypothetical protein